MLVGVNRRVIIKGQNLQIPNESIDFNGHPQQLQPVVLENFANFGRK
jgi:hypothetical protein